EGPVAAPSKPERARRDMAYGEAAAARAESRNEWERAARMNDRASRAAYWIGEHEKAGEYAQSQMQDSEKAGSAAQMAWARINLGVAEHGLGDFSRAEELPGSAVAGAVA